MTKTHWRKCDKSDYLGACDIETREVNLTIERVVMLEAKIRGSKKLARVAYFKEKGFKPMIVNVGNGKFLKDIAESSHLEDWLNIPVCVYVDEKVSFGRDIVEGLRFSHQKKKPVLTDSHPKWQGAKDALKQGNTTIESIKKAYQLSDVDAKKLQS